MPGIYGLSSQGVDLKSDINAMSDAMLLYSHFQQDEQFVDKCLGASRVHLGKIGQKRAPYAGANGCRVWIEGEVYNLPEVLLQFGWAGPKTKNDSFPIWILHAYHEGKLDKFLNYLDGYFCATIYDPNCKKVLLISDRYGMRMLYWYHHNGLFAWASEVKGLLAIDKVDRSIDSTSLPCFMNLGYLLGEHTWFKHIRLIKPANILEHDIDSGTVSQRYYWTWGEINSSKLSFDEAVDSLYETFTESVRRRFDPNERIGIALSGGLDSRAIFAAVNHLYPNYEGYAYTFGIPNCDDIRIAQQVASRSNWRHEEFHFSSHNWFQPRKEMVWNTDGMMDIMHMHGSEFLGRIAEKMDVNLNGYAGDVVAGGGWVGVYPKNIRANSYTLKKIYKEYVQLADLQDAYFDIEDVEPGLLASRVRRFTNMGTVNGLVMIDQRKPFFDNKVIEWAYSVSSDYRVANRVYSVMLQRYFPKYFKDIPWQKTGKPAGVVSKSFMIRVANKLVRIGKSYAGIQNSKNYTDYSKWICNPEIAHQLEDLLSMHNSYHNKLTHEDWQQEFLKPHLASRSIDNSEKILRACSVELYLRRIFNQK